MLCHLLIYMNICRAPHLEMSQKSFAAETVKRYSPFRADPLRSGHVRLSMSDNISLYTERF